MKPVETMTDAELREELAAQGIDLDAAKARLTPKLDELMRARAVRQALAAVRDNPLPQHSPLPWFSRKWTIRSAKGIVGDLLTDEDAACIAAAVNSAPILTAEVERLTALLAAARVAVEKWPDGSHTCTFDEGDGFALCLYCDAANVARTEARRAVGLEG